MTTVAREVGVEGRLGGQANVPGASGTWKDLTGNVNLLAANLTTQVRAIAEVATAVTKGDLTQSIQVDARGEVSELKDNINTMIDNLRLTTERNSEQDWLKTNLARITNMLQGQRDLATVGRMLLSELALLVEAQNGVIYLIDTDAALLKNLLSNAFKFTERGGVKLAIKAVKSSCCAEHPTLQHASTVVAFEVADTGIGIPPEKQRIIFEAFQQADASTNRKYGGTGLGLAISRELANLLGGEIRLQWAAWSL